MGKTKIVGGRGCSSKIRVGGGDLRPQGKFIIQNIS